MALDIHEMVNNNSDVLKVDDIIDSGSSESYVKSETEANIVIRDSPLYVIDWKLKRIKHEQTLLTNNKPSFLNQREGHHPKDTDL